MPENMLKAMVEKEAEAAGLDPDFVFRLIGRESDWRPGAVSEKGAAGIMQLMPETAKAYGVTDRFNSAQNIKGGIAFLKDLTKKYGAGRTDLIAAAYNAGETAVDKHGGIPPFKETQAYVAKVDPFAEFEVKKQPGPTPAATAKPDPFAEFEVKKPAWKPGQGTNPPIAKAEDFMAQPQAGQPPEGSAVGRLAQGAWDVLNPVEAVKGLYNAGRHPIDTASNIIQSHLTQGMQAVEAAKQGRYMEAAGHGAAAGIPLIGPAAAHAGEVIASGDVARGVGQGVGLILPFGAQAASDVRTAVTGPRRAQMLERAASERVSQRVLAPGAAKYKGIADYIAPEVLAKKLRGSREELQQAAAEGMEASGVALDDAIQQAGGVRAPISTQAVIKKLRDKILDLQDENGIAYSGEAAGRIKLLQERITQMRGHGAKTGEMPFERMRNLRDEQYRIAKDARAYERMGNPVKSDEGWAAQQTGSAIREVFADHSPAAARANAEFSFWKNLNDVLDPVLGRPKAQTAPVGVTGGRRVQTGLVFHMLGAGPFAALVGSELLPWLSDMMASPRWHLMRANQKMELATALRKRSPGMLRSIMSRQKLLKADVAGGTNANPEGATERLLEGLPGSAPQPQP